MTVDVPAAQALLSGRAAETARVTIGVRHHFSKEGTVPSFEKRAPCLLFKEGWGQRCRRVVPSVPFWCPWMRFAGPEASL